MPIDKSPESRYDSNVNKFREIFCTYYLDFGDGLEQKFSFSETASAQDFHRHDPDTLGHGLLQGLSLMFNFGICGSETKMSDEVS